MHYVNQFFRAEKLADALALEQSFVAQLLAVGCQVKPEHVQCETVPVQGAFVIVVRVAFESGREESVGRAIASCSPKQATEETK